MASLFKRGKKWYIGWLDGKQRKMISTKTNDKQLAMEALRKFEEEQTRKALGLEPVAKVQQIMLSDFISAYQEDRKRIGKSRQTISIDVFALTGLRKFTGNCNLETITVNAVLQFRNYLLDNVQKTTASIRLRSLMTAFEWAVSKPGDKYLRSNPFRQKGLIPVSKEKQKNLSLTTDERVRFLEAIDDPHHDLLLRFMLLSGARRSETANLEWDDIDLKNRVINIQQTKTHRCRAVPISVELMQVIMALDRSRPKPFNYTPNSISRLFRIYRRKAGLREELHCHSLRHSCATQLANQGIPLHKVKDFMGHSSLEITQIYLHSSDEDMREVAEAVTCLG